MGYRKVFRKVKIKDLMPANDSHIGYVAHDKSVWAEKSARVRLLYCSRKSIFMVSIVLIG